ncbi:MAG: twin-arginine translocase subunit TatC [Rickettsiales bacterium]
MKKEISFSEHFLELKKRLTFTVVVFILSVILGYYYSADLYSFLLKPLENYFIQNNLKREIIYTGLSEAFFTYLKLACYFGLFLSLPVLVWQIYAFLSPGLKRDEKRFVLPLFVFAPFLFFIGAVLVYYYILPQVFSFFLSFEQTQASKTAPVVLEARVSEYLSLCLSIMIAFGLAFELPIILIILAKIKLISYKSLIKFRRFSIVIILILAAILTPPDILSQIFLAIIMIILYELSILICMYIEKKK